MKKIIIFIAVFSMCNAAQSQSPLLFNYSATVKNVSGVPIINQTVSFRFSIITGSSTGTVEYAETQNVITDNFGLASLKVGAGIVLSGNMSNIQWESNDCFLKVELDTAGGSTYVDMGTTHMNSVPYSLYAEKAGYGGTPWVLSGNNIYNSNSGNIGISETNPQFRLYVKQAFSDPDTIPLFEIKDKDGYDILVMYPDSIRVIIKDDTAGTDGSFTVCGRNSTTNITNNFLKITPDIIRFYGDTSSGGIVVKNHFSTSYNIPIAIGSNTTDGNEAYLSNGGVWTNTCSREFKDRFTSISGADVLDKISAMNVKGWYYKDTNEYHIGPVAEDFYSAFGCGQRDVKADIGKYIASGDMAGVALLAVQELNKEMKELKLSNQNVKNKSDELRAMLSDLESRVSKLESR